MTSEPPDPRWQLERRPFGDADVQQLLAEYVDGLRTAIPGYDHTLAAPPSPEDFDWPNGAFLVVSTANGPAACGAVRRIDEHVGEIRRMYVRAAWRGQGLARFLLAALEDLGREMQLEEMCLDTSGELSPAIGLYRSSGYEEVAPYNDNPFADLWFSKRL